MCTFCEIVSGQIPAKVVYEDERCMAFLDIDPIAEGHMLLIPKEHYLDADDMPEALYLHLMSVSRRLIAALKKVCLPDGYSVMQNGGRFNDVGHYHLHLFPRNVGDGFGWTSRNETFGEHGELADKIRMSLQ